MLHLIFGGALWSRAQLGDKQTNYEDLARGWAKWTEGNGNADISEASYPYVKAFDLAVSPPALRRLLLGMLNPDPERRTSIAEVANNRWLKAQECCQVDSYDEPVATIDAAKGKASLAKVAVHNHLPEKEHKMHRLVRLPGSTDMDY